ARRRDAHRSRARSPFAGGAAGPRGARCRGAALARRSAARTGPARRGPPGARARGERGRQDRARAPCGRRPRVAADTVPVSRSNIDTLVHARRLAGGVSRLAEAIDVDAYVLDEMLHGIAETPSWVL